MTNSPFQSDEDLLASLPSVERDPIRTAEHLKQLLDVPEVRNALDDVRQMWFKRFLAASGETARLEAQAGAVAIDTLELIFRRIIDAGEREITERNAAHSPPAPLDL